MKRNNIFLCFLLAGNLYSLSSAQNKPSEFGQAQPEIKKKKIDSYEAALSTLSAEASKKDEHNYLIGNPPGIRKNRVPVLSVQMAEALKKYNPAFTIVGIYEFPSFIANAYSSKDKIPSAVFGDFNGDGKMDVVLMGYDEKDDKKAFIVVLLSEKKRFKVIEIAWLMVSREGCMDYGAEVADASIKKCGIMSILDKVSSGRKIKERLEWGRPKIELATDAFESIAFEKASCIYLYKDGEFVSYPMSD